jgi:hypothetical protein
MNTTSIDQRITALDTERAAVVAELRRLQAAHARATDEHVALLGAVGRGKPFDENELDAVSGELVSLEGEIAQKRAALTQIDSDLRLAGIDREEAEVGGLRARLDGLRNEYVQLVAELDESPLRIDHWRRLREVAQSGNRMILNWKRDRYGSTPFKMVDGDIEFWFKRWGVELYASLLNPRRPDQLKRPSELLQVDRLNATIDGLLKVG